MYVRSCIVPIPTQLAWDVSERSQSDLHWERHLRDLLEIFQKRWLFCDVFKTSQIQLKKGVFCVRSLDVSNKSQKRCLFRDFYATSQKHLTQEFVAFQNYPTKIFWRDFRRVIEISYKIDGWPLETLKKWNFFWLQCTAINRVCHE